MKAIWVVVIALVMAGASGAGAYYYVNSKATTEKNDLQNQITALEKEVATLKVAETTTSTTTPTTSTTPTTTTTTSKQEICTQIFPSYKYTREAAKVGDYYCSVDKISSDDNYALGQEGTIANNTGGGPGATWLATKVNGKWIKIQSTQDAWDCVLLKKYYVPKAFIVTETCLNSTTQKQEAY